jgi:hypothetical protein
MQTGDNVYPTDNAAYVGIGTTDPRWNLEVFNPASTDRDVSLTLYNSRTNRDAIIRLYTLTDDKDAAIFLDDSDEQKLKFSAGDVTDPTALTDNTRMTLTQTGNLGIGTTAPAERLHVVGKIRMVDGNEGNGNVLTSDADGTASWQPAPSGTLSGGTPNRLTYWTGPSAVAAATDLAWDNTNGRLGIGTSTSTERLNLNGNLLFTRGATRAIRVEAQSGNTAGNNLEIRAGNAAGIAFAVPGGDVLIAAGHGYNATVSGADGGDVILRSGGNLIDGIDDGGDIIFQVGGPNNSTATNFIERARITEEGRLGIGTATPSASLHIGSGGTFRMENGATAGWVLTSDNQGNASWQPAGGLGGGTTGRVPYWTSASTIGNSGMTWDNTNSRLGIGTTSPTAALDVKGSNAEINIERYAGSAATFNLGSSPNATIGNFTTPINNGSVLGIINFNGANGSTFGTGGSIEAQAVQPWSGTNRGTSLRFYTTAVNSTVPALRMIVDQSGNIGIGGITTPTHTLHLDGTLRLVDGTQGDGKVLTSNANGVASWQPAGGLSGGTTGRLPYWTSGNTMGNTGMTWDNTNSRLGIGTTAPTTILDVQSNATVANLTNYSTTAASGAILNIGHVLGSTIGAIGGGSVVTNGATLGTVGFTGADGVVLATGAAIVASADQNWSTGARGSSLQFQTAANGTTTPTTRMTITNAGRLGIGTTTPSEQLSLSGNLAFTAGTFHRIDIEDNASGDGNTLELVAGGSTGGTGGTMFVTGGGSNHPTGRGGDLYLQGGFFNHSTSVLPGGDVYVISGQNLSATSAGSAALDGGTIYFHTGTINGTTERMRIQPTGRIGMGSTSAPIDLDIVGTLRLQGNGAAAGQVLTSDAAGKATWQAPGGLSGGQANRLTYWTSATTVDDASELIYTSSGRLGIGTTAPSEQLGLSGNIGFTSTASHTIGVDNNTTGDGQNLRVQAGRSSTGDGGDLQLVAGSFTHGTNDIIPGGDVIIRSGSNTTTNTGVNGGNIYLQVGGAGGGVTDVMKIRYDGNVGINNQNARHKLDIGANTTGSAGAENILLKVGSPSRDANTATGIRITNGTDFAPGTAQYGWDILAVQRTDLAPVLIFRQDNTTHIRVEPNGDTDISGYVAGRGLSLASNFEPDEATTSSGTWTNLYSGPVYISPGTGNVQLAVNARISGSGTPSGRVRFLVGTATSSEITLTNTVFSTFTVGLGSVPSTGWQTLIIQGRTTGGSGPDVRVSTWNLISD